MWLRECAWDGCSSTAIVARGLCRRDYVRAHRSAALDSFVAPDRACATCGRGFPEGSRRSRAKFCSTECRRQRRQVARVTALSSRACVRCGEAVPVARRSDAAYCSTACQQANWYSDNDDRLRVAARAWKSDNRAAANDASNRRRARMLGQPYERIDRNAVWLRDGGRCWICLREVDATVTSPHPDSPSLDHIVPVVRGGGHVMSNVALAHLRCNIVKKDKIIDRRPAWAS